MKNCIEVPLSKKQVNTLKTLSFAGSDVGDIDNCECVHIFHRGNKIIAKLPSDKLYSVSKFLDLVGIAECSPSDTYSEQFGIRLAVSKLLKKVYERVKTILLKEKKEYLSRVEKALYMADQNQKHLKYHIHSLQTSHR